MTKIQEIFANRFNYQPIVIQSPGRINLIGEHTDYNDGFVLPAAIDRYVTLAMGRNAYKKLRFFAADLNEYFEYDLLQPLQPATKGWANYLLGGVAELQKVGFPIGGVDCVFSSTIPIGAGLSSSAALSCGFLFGVNELFDYQLDKVVLAKLGQKVEHHFIGVKVGIMDQFASLLGKSNHFLRLDCRSLGYDFFPFRQHDYCLLLCDTKVRHRLASSEYNLRREECEKGVQFLKQSYPKIKHLRDVKIGSLNERREEIPALLYKRCRYVVEENQRVLDACVALKNKDLDKVGRLMFASHEGLSKMYEVSCKELDFLVETAASCGGVAGARMMGGGFGGCTLNLIKEEQISDFMEVMKKSYWDFKKIDLPIYEVKLSSGVFKDI